MFLRIRCYPAAASIDSCCDRVRNYLQECFFPRVPGYIYHRPLYRVSVSSYLTELEMFKTLRDYCNFLLCHCRQPLFDTTL